MKTGYGQKKAYLPQSFSCLHFKITGVAECSNNIEGYIPNFGQYKNSRDGFTYDKENDRYICSQGKYLVFKKISESHGGTYKMRSYRSSSKDCGACPLRNVCIGKSGFKKIENTVDKPLYDRMHIKLQTPKAKRMKKLRSSTVEPVLGTLINYLGMRRVSTRGIMQANKCMIMAAVAYNLKKLLKWKETKVETAIMSLKKGKKGLYFYFLWIWQSMEAYCLRSQPIYCGY